jgi:hypothetical protein
VPRQLSLTQPKRPHAPRYQPSGMIGGKQELRISAPVFGAKRRRLVLGQKPHAISIKPAARGAGLCKPPSFLQNDFASNS